MRKPLSAAAAASALAAILFAGNYHVITSDRAVLPHIVPRVTFSLREFIVNQDALVAMPLLVKMREYPLSTMALERYFEQQIKEGRRIAEQP